MAKTATAKKPGTALALGGFKTGAMLPKTSVKSGGSGDAFIWVSHPMSKKLWKEMSSKVKNLQEAELIFVSAALVERLQPMKFHLVEAFKFFAYIDNDGDITQAWDETSDAVPKDAAEIVEALVIVYTSKGPKPARITFKKAVCKAVGPMLDEYKEVLDPTWAKRSKDNEVAAKNIPADMAGLRFYGEATTCPKPTKDGKFTYPLGSVKVHTSTSSEFSELKDVGDDFTQSLESSRQAFQSRVSDVRSKF